MAEPLSSQPHGSDGREGDGDTLLTCVPSPLYSVLYPMGWRMSLLFRFALHRNAFIDTPRAVVLVSKVIPNPVRLMVKITCHMALAI